VVPDFASAVVPALNYGAGVARPAVVARILNELDMLGRQIVLALDDYHRIADRECHERLGLLLERPPSMGG
jgi:ATP/maltotriose-dependent transcriptional regulator MalT